MRFGLGLVFLLAACGDAIEVGNASDQAALANDRKLAELAEEIHGKWIAELPIDLPITISIEMTLGQSDDDNARSGALLMRCVGTFCDTPLIPPLPGGGTESRSPGDLINGPGTYQVTDIDGGGTGLGILRDPNFTVTQFVVPKGAEALTFPYRLPGDEEDRELRFTRVP